MSYLYQKHSYRFLTFLFALFMIRASSQVMINEYSCANMSQTPDNYGEYNDWVELYNAGTSSANIGGYYMSDNFNNPDKWAFPAGTAIPAGGFLRVICSGRNVVSGIWYHTGYKMTQCKPEEICFSDAAGNILDSLTLRRNQTNHSWGRPIDGGSGWWVFMTPTLGASNTTSTAYSPYATTPVFSVSPGFYPGSQNLSITSPDPNVTIHYTTNGFEPTTADPVYSGAISIASTQVVRARAFSASATVPASFIESNSYFINVTHGVATVSIYGDQLMTLMTGSWNAEPTTGLEYFDKGGVFRTEVTGTTNKHGNDSWAYAQRGIDFVSEDPMGYNDALDWPLFHRKDRPSFQKVILKAAANDNYPFENGAHIRDAYVHDLSQEAGLALDERTFESCVLYVNGAYWGVYEIREKVDDHDFTDYYYDQDEDHLQFLKTWGGTWSEYGGTQAQTDWNAFVTFVTTNNMATAANWAYVDSVYNWHSLCDYIILNSICVTSDWLNWNTAWWRGTDTLGDKKKWRYALWDNDATFGHYINYTGIPDTSPNADPCDPEGLPDPGGQGHVPIVNALMANPTFKQYYVNRFVDLMNTTFSCDSMLTLLDTCIAHIAPEMPAQCAKWGGSVATWQSNVTTLRSYITTRCSTLVQGMMDCYNLNGPYNIVVDVMPAGAGTVTLNSLNLDQFPWSGMYYGGIPIILTTTPTSSQYTFDHWEIVDAASPNIQSSSITTDLTQPQTIVAHYIEEVPPAILSNVFIPTAFSPNGDQNNDVFYIHGIDPQQTFNFRVFNRWGQIVFQTSSMSYGWDGTTDGKMNPSDVYAYMIEVRNPDGTSESRSGNITLMR
jgi:gliding motility-associated-like protein